MDKFYFSEPFESQLRRALGGYAPWRSKTAQRGITAERMKNKAMQAKPPSEKQIYWLKKHNVPIPATMAEASTLLDEVFRRK
jgi:hypothetical protein